MHWDADAACPDHAEVLARVDRLVADETAPTDFTADAHVDRGAQGFRLSLTIALHDRPPALWEIDAEQCDALASATALLIAMALDPIAVVARTEAAVQPIVPAPPPSTPALQAAPAIVEPPAPPPVRERSPRTRGSFAAFVGGAIGMQPRIAALGGARLGVARGRFAADLGWRITSPTSAFYDDRRSLGGTVRSWSFVARACVRPRVGRVELPVCGGGALGIVRARGVGSDEDRTVRALRGAVVASAGVRVPFAKRFAFTVAVDTEVPVRRQSYYVEEFTESRRAVYLDGPVAVLPTAALEVAFP